MELKKLVWQEQYRPNTINDVVGDFTLKIREYIKIPESIPNFLFYSRAPGTGKTTTAKAIINELQCDALVLNSSDDRKIEVIRDKIKYFVKVQATNGKRKCVFLDEVDGMLKPSQDALRNLMETYTKNVFFILTCNHIDKVIEPLRSRCVEIDFSRPGKQDMYQYLEKICQQEELKYTNEGLLKLIEYEYPSIRNCVNYLQDLKIQGLQLTEETVKKSEDLYLELWQEIKEAKFMLVKQKIIDENVDCLALNRWLFYYLCGENLPANQLAKTIRILADNEYKIKVGADPTIIFLSSIAEIMIAVKPVVKNEQ